jgi:hypothetical protein
MKSRPLFLFALVIGLAPGCDDGSAPTEIHSYVDSTGRSCTVDANDITSVATCDVSASTILTCATGTEAVFVTNPAYDTMTHVWSLQSCAGCIDRTNHRTNIEATSCANITCVNASDCIESSYMCVAGVCQHM